MPLKRAPAALLALALAFAIAAPCTAHAAPSRLTPVTQSVLSPPRWFAGDDGRWHLHYEIVLTNTVDLQVGVTSLDILAAGGRRITRLSGGRLRAAMSRLGTSTPTTELPPSSSGVVWVDLDLPTRRAIPAAVRHRLTVDPGPSHPP